MGKFILLMTFLILGLLISLSIISPATPVLWLASATMEYNIVRFVLMVILFGLLITRPPRNQYFRYVAGVVATMVSGWALASTYQAQMQVLDCLSILAACISMGITVLEINPAQEKTVISEHSQAGSTENLKPAAA